MEQVRNPRELPFHPGMQRGSAEFVDSQRYLKNLIDPNLFSPSTITYLREMERQFLGMNFSTPGSTPYMHHQNELMAKEEGLSYCINQDPKFLNLCLQFSDYMLKGIKHRYGQYTYSLQAEEIRVSAASMGGQDILTTHLTPEISWGDVWTSLHHMLDAWEARGYFNGPTLVKKIFNMIWYISLACGYDNIQEVRCEIGDFEIRREFVARLRTNNSSIDVAIEEHDWSHLVFLIENDMRRLMSPRLYGADSEPGFNQWKQELIMDVNRFARIFFEYTYTAVTGNHGGFRLTSELCQTLEGIEWRESRMVETGSAARAWSVPRDGSDSDSDRCSENGSDLWDDHDNRHNPENDVEQDVDAEEEVDVEEDVNIEEEVDVDWWNAVFGGEDDAEDDDDEDDADEEDNGENDDEGKAED